MAPRGRGSPARPKDRRRDHPDRLRPLRRATSRPTPSSLARRHRADGAALAAGARPRPQGAPTHLGRRADRAARTGEADEVHRRSPPCPASPRRWSCSPASARRRADDAPYDAEVLRRAAGAAVRALTGRRRSPSSLPGTDAPSRRRRRRGRRCSAPTVFAGTAASPDAKAAGQRGHRRSPPTPRDQRRQGRGQARRASWPSAQAYTRDLVNTAPEPALPADLRRLGQGRSATGSQGQASRCWTRRRSPRAASAASSASARARSTPPRIVDPDATPRPRRQGLDRPRRQGHHVRLRRPVHQAGRPAC